MQRLANPADADAWSEFERCYQAAIYRYARARGLQPTDAKDVVQEVMLAVHRQAATWQSTGRKGSFRAWLWETARRTSLAHIRRRERGGKNGSSVMQYLKEVANNPSASEVEGFDHECWRFYCAAAEVEASANALHWKAFWFTAVDGLPAEEVSRRTGLSIGAIYSARCRIQAKLRRVIQAGSDYERGGS